MIQTQRGSSFETPTLDDTSARFTVEGPKRQFCQPPGSAPRITAASLFNTVVNIGHRGDRFHKFDSYIRGCCCPHHHNDGAGRHDTI